MLMIALFLWLFPSIFKIIINILNAIFKLLSIDGNDTKAIEYSIAENSIFYNIQYWGIILSLLLSVPFAFIYAGSARED